MAYAVVIHIVNQTEVRAMELFWSRCKLGPARVYWVVGVFGEDILIEDGYCETVGEAEERARQVAGPDAWQGRAYMAEGRHRRKVYEERKSRTSRSTGAEVRRFVYRADYSEYDGSRYAMAHPILKWTGKRAYVGEKYCSADLVGTEEEPVFDHGPDERTFVLDRAALEAEGHAYPRSRRWWGLFYLRLEDALDPRGDRHGSPTSSVVEALAVLGLAWPCTFAEFRNAYRQRSQETHPDCGGSPGSFVEVNAAYEAVKSGMAYWPEFA